MKTNYKINLINHSLSDQKFWCFLGEPKASFRSTVFANSDTYVIVPINDGSQRNSFNIPWQNVVAVGASNEAVASGAHIESSVTERTGVEVMWEADYSEKKPPTLKQSGRARTLTIQSNYFNKGLEMANQRYGSMTYGVQSDEGFLGITWSPAPGTRYQIEPRVRFYVAIGDFQSNRLADIPVISRSAAEVTESEFDANGEATVVLSVDGNWQVYAGPPR